MVDEWLAVETLPRLGNDEVQLWRAELPCESTSPEVYEHLLSPEERTRAERLRGGRVRSQFVVARTVLRTLLGNCMALDPKHVSITQTSFGKPETPGMFFNVSHSGSAILIALCRTHSVGTDVEHLSRKVEALEIAKHSFTRIEYAALSAIADQAALRRAFFQCWTRKEAVIKADGRGLSLALDSFEVPVGEAPATEMVIPVGDEGTTVRYHVRDIAYGDEMVAAYAIATPHCTPVGLIFPLASVVRKRQV